MTDRPKGPKGPSGRPRALVLSHLSFEDTGTLGTVLSKREFEVTTIEPAVSPLEMIDPDEPDLLIVLGGPIGVYDERTYPHIPGEMSFIGRRLKVRKPIIGICLGAQLIARALGARVYPSGLSEIGWLPLHLTPDGSRTCLASLGDGKPMFHWHGDTFESPPGLVSLASTASIQNQAFMVGRFGLALQCHPEIRRLTFERWLIGHAYELAAKGIDVDTLRRQTMESGPDLESRAEIFFSCWLEENSL